MKKYTALILSFLMCVFLLAGCNKTSSATSQNNASAETPGTTSGGNTSNLGTTGKFVQKDITPPDLGNAYIDSLRLMPDNSVLAISISENNTPAAHKSIDGSSWENIFPFEGTSIFNEYPQHLFQFNVDNDGNWWVAACTPEGDNNHLFKVSGSNVQEVSFSLFQGASTYFASSLQIDNDNTMLISCGSESGGAWGIIDCSGATEINSFSPSSVQPTFSYYQNGKIYCGSFGESVIAVFDKNGNSENKHSIPVDTETISMFKGCVQDDSVAFYADTTGIHKVAFGGSYVETLTDNTGYAYANASFGISQLVAVPDGSFWLLGNIGARNTAVYRYWFDENAAANAENTLTVWAMDDSSMLRLATSTFIKDNPDYDVIVEYGHSGDNTAQTEDDIIRTLNTRLLAGDAPDVLILDNLPLLNMAKQGILCDLSGLVNESDYFEKIINAYTIDGKTYAYPSLFWAPIMTQKDKSQGPVISSVTSLEDFRNLSSTSQITYGGYYHLFETMYIASSAKIFPNDSSVNEAELKNFLSLTKDIADAQNIGNKEYDNEFGDHFNYNNAAQTTKFDTFLGTSPCFGFYSNEYIGDANYAAGTFYDYDLWVFGEVGGTAMPLPGNAFFPLYVAGVPENAPNIEGGKLFVKNMLECQTIENLAGIRLPGLSVRKGLNRADFLTAPEDFLKDANIDVDKINLDGALEKLDTPASTNYGLRQKVYTTAEQLYNGKISLDEAVAAIIKNTELYFAEQQ